MKKLIMLAGIPGSGKSTIAKKLQEENASTFIIESDQTRLELTGSYLIFPSDMHVIFNIMIDKANKLYDEHENFTLILDSTFLSDYRRFYFMEKLKKFDENYLILVKVHNKETCYLRNKMRQIEKWVPEDVIDDMFKEYVDPSFECAKLFNKITTIYTD